MKEQTPRDTETVPVPAPRRTHFGHPTGEKRRRAANEIRAAAQRAGREWQQPETD
ncbi:hypothetical protein [Amycolatopsis sp. NPDC051903]|uniref:hypothetical protein n=1 Tax=Amycolatopsis sp. NPDC051903 TaxID=3363936 RepID=UPI00379C30E0